MGNHLHIVGSAVEAGKDEGHVVIRKLGAVATPSLAGASQHIHQLHLSHGIPELLGLWAQLPVEGGAHLQNLLRISYRTGIAGAEGERVISKVHGVFLPQPFGLGAVNLLRHGDQIFPHRLPEPGHLLFSVAAPLHPAVAKTGVAAKAQGFAHLVPNLDQPVEQAVQLFAMVPVPPALRLPGRQAAGVIGILFKGSQLGQGIYAAFKGDLRRGQETGIGRDQLVLQLQIRYDLWGKSFEAQFIVQK